jgi:DUF1680 family protein
MRKYESLEITEIQLNDPVFAPRVDTVIKKTIPTCIQQSHKTGRFEAFKLNWEEGMPNKPHVFWDSDVAKIVEGMAMALALRPDAKLEEELEKYVELIISAQQPDGYLNVVFTTQRKDERWKDLFKMHELYCAGHLMEAAVAHHKATGRRNFLDCMCRYADYIASVFGTEKEKIHGYPGHQEIELALCKLAKASGKQKYFDLAAYFVNERGKTANYFLTEQPEADERALQNRQAHKPVREQTDAVGHAVRAVYLYAGMADVAAEFNDATLSKACENLWRSIVNKRMYITGGIGSTWAGEAFTVDYNLPNDTAYAESCAAIGLVFFAQRMLNATGDAIYADVMEQSLYNNALSGISLDGEQFFYANMLEVDDNSFEHSHISKTRQKWFTCSCCPTNYCRFLPQLGSFVWSAAADEVRLNMPVASKLARGIEVSGGYPYDGKIMIRFTAVNKCKFSLRIPGWCKKHELKLNGKVCVEKPLKGYVTFERKWQAGDEIQLDLVMPVRIIYPNPKITSDAGKIALMRGPIVYALESIDNGKVIPQLVIDPEQEFTLSSVADLPDGTVALQGYALLEEQDSDALYSIRKPKCKTQKITAIPYALWQNRGDANMAVWLRRIDLK